MRKKLTVMIKLIGITSVISMGIISIIGSNNGGHGYRSADPINPWNVTATAATWLTTNPYDDFHDGGWVYSADEDVLYAMYGNDNSGKTLYRIDYIDETYETATTWSYNRHGSHPVIDDTGTYIYMPPSQYSEELERYNTVTDVREDLETAPDEGTFSHGAWKNGQLWIVLDDDNLYSYNPSTDSWSSALHDFGGMANVAASGPNSDLIYVIVADNGDFYSYDVTTDTVTTLDSHPDDFELGGNGMFTWFGAQTGFIYADGGCEGTPAIYDIAGGIWHSLSDPKTSNNCEGHATYDSQRQRLYIADNTNGAWYYQY